MPEPLDDADRADALNEAALSRTLAADLVLDRKGERFTRAIDDRWSFAGRMFGGYSGSLLVAAAAQVATMPELLSASVAFLRGLEPGPIEIDVEQVRAGRSAWVGRAVLRQAGRPALIGDTWFAAEGTLPSVDAAPEPPAGGTSMDWLAAEFPFMNAFEERGIAYPLDRRRDVPDPPPVIEVWARPDERLDVSTPLERQLFTFMLADLHIIDAAVRPHGMVGALGLSHNLTMHWTGIPGSTGWYGLRAEGVGSGTFAATRGVVQSAVGECAWVLQQGRVVPFDAPHAGAPT